MGVYGALELSVTTPECTGSLQRWVILAIGGGCQHSQATSHKYLRCHDALWPNPAIPQIDTRLIVPLFGACARRPSLESLEVRCNPAALVPVVMEPAPDAPVDALIRSMRA